MVRAQKLDARMQWLAHVYSYIGPASLVQQAVTGKTREEVALEVQGMSWGTFKPLLADATVEHLVSRDPTYCATTRMQMIPPMRPCLTRPSSARPCDRRNLTTLASSHLYLRV